MGVCSRPIPSAALFGSQGLLLDNFMWRSDL
jgi:hypothetical protein